MEKLVLFALALLLSVGVQGSSNLGVVSPVTRCGGLGTPIQLRISGCEGSCSFTPGTPYNAEFDFMPSSSARSLTLRVDVCISGFCYVILEAELVNSSVQPGFIYTAKYSIVPNDILSGQTISLQAYIYHTDIDRVEACLEIEAAIL